MNEHINPVVAATPCAKCGARQWRRVGTKLVEAQRGSLDKGLTVETYECGNGTCPGLEQNGKRYPWPISWAHQGRPT